MYRAITFIELLTVLSITVISLYFISPVIFRFSDYIIFQYEIDQIKSFFHQVQTKSRYSQQGYSVTLANQNNQWCLIAIQKENTAQHICDCFHLSSCHIENKHYFIYHNRYPSEIRSNSLYPKHFINISSNAGNSNESCLKLVVNKLFDVVQIDDKGMIYVAQKNKRTQCRLL